MTDETSATSSNATTISDDGDNHTPSNNKLDSIIYSAGTDVGMRREENQDSYGIMLGEGYRLFIVADGMGGVKGGSIASNLTIAVVERKLRDRAFLTAEDIIDALATANIEVFKKGNIDASLNGMGTTFVALFMTPTGVYTVHVGDSRIYHISGGRAVTLTEDHTLVQELVRSGAITPEQAEHHPVAHMLTRSIGPGEEVEVDCNLVKKPVQAGDRFLLCSDGLYNLVTEAEIGEICTEFSTDDAVQYLIDLANERGGTDNITIIIVDTAHYSLLNPTAVPITQKKLPAKTLVEAIEVEANDSTPPIASTSSVSVRKGYHETSEVQEDSQTKNIDDDQQEKEREGEEEEGDFIAVDQPGIPQDLILEQPAESQIATTTASVGQQRFYMLLGIGFLGGLLASYLYFSTSLSHRQSAEEITEALPTMTVEETSPSALTLTTTTVPTVEERKPQPKVIQGSQDPVIVAPSVELLANDTMKFGPAERSSILKRKKDLEASIKDTDFRLAILRSDRSTDAENLQRTAAHRAEEAATKIEQLRTDIEVATRQFAVWYDRKRRLESSDRVSMASELAPTVASVKSKKEEFEKITWDYLKEVEALRYGTADVNREQKLADLAKKRSDKMKELSEEVRKAIEKSVESADDTVAELTLQRSGLEKTLDNTRQELEFARTAASADSLKKLSIIETLKAKREASATELEELEKLLPNASF